MDFWGVLRTTEAGYLYAGAVLGALVTLAVFVIVNAIVRDSPARRIRRAERAKRRLDRAVRSAARHGIVPHPAPQTPRPFSGRVGNVGRLDRTGFVDPGPRQPGPRDWAPDGH
ncbi:hypothetical protein ACTJI8_15705 [Microbacterium sp. 22303]|uniref:hypothetical protein n=1 Tax=Microbacterium sp. 22303 TaxID=3453905 RepID=UPI003F85BCBA